MLDVSQSSSKKADQDLEKIRFYSLGWPTENSRHWQAYQRAGA